MSKKKSHVKSTKKLSWKRRSETIRIRCPWWLFTLYLSWQAHLSQWPLLYWFGWKRTPAPWAWLSKEGPTPDNLCLALSRSRWGHFPVYVGVSTIYICKGNQKYPKCKYSIESIFFKKCNLNTKVFHLSPKYFNIKSIGFTVSDPWDSN